MKSPLYNITPSNMKYHLPQKTSTRTVITMGLLFITPHLYCCFLNYIKSMSPNLYKPQESIHHVWISLLNGPYIHIYISLHSSPVLIISPFVYHLLSPWDITMKSHIIPFYPILSHVKPYINHILTIISYYKSYGNRTMIY